MSKWLTTFVLSGIILVLTLGASVEAAPSVNPENFYKGATINFIVPFAPGGTYDLLARALVPYLQKHTGATVVITTMEGAGGLVGGAHLYNSAKPDGLTIGIVPLGGMTLLETLGAEGVRYEIGKFTYIVRPDMAPYGLYVSKASGWKTIGDMQKAGKVRFGAVDRTLPLSVIAAIVTEAFGLKSKITAGYKGSKEIMLAVVAGRELDACCTTLATEFSNFVKSGEVTLVASISKTRLKEFTQVPAILEVPGLTPEGKRLLELAMFVGPDFPRAIVAPPGTPSERALFLEKAFMASLREPMLTDWAGKQGLMISPLSAEGCKAMVAKLREIVPPAEIPRIKDIIMKKYY